MRNRPSAPWFTVMHLVLTATILWPEAAAAADPGEPAVTAIRELQLGYVAFDSGDFEAAMDHYARARDLAWGDEQRFNALLGLGSSASELARYDEARVALEEAHALKPGEVGATFTLGVVCRRQGDLECAVRRLAEAAARDPEMTEALVELGIAYGALERHPAAERACREALELEPDHAEARLGLAVALFHQDRASEAVVEFRRLLELAPDNLRAHYGLGLALLFAGDRQGAIEEIVYLNERAPALGADLHGWVFPDQ